MAQNKKRGCMDLAQQGYFQATESDGNRSDSKSGLIDAGVGGGGNSIS